jgi:hypothetical protein
VIVDVFASTRATTDPGISDVKARILQIEIAGQPVHHVVVDDAVTTQRHDRSPFRLEQLATHTLVAGRALLDRPVIAAVESRPEIAEETMRECAELGIKQVWMHRGPGAGSVSRAAAAYGRQRGIAVIDGGCPCMFDPTADLGHKAMRMVFTLTGNVPRQV